jgi:hypothetical protein
MQVIEFKAYFSAEFLSNPGWGLQWRGFATAGDEFSTQLSTFPVDIGTARLQVGTGQRAIQPIRHRASAIIPRAAPTENPIAFDHTSGRLADLALAVVLGGRAGADHRTALPPA